MNLLHVEDDEDWHAKFIAPSLKEQGIVVQLATSFEAARQAIEENHFDYLLLDMAIPLESNGTGSAHHQYGIQLFHEVRQRFAGLPIMILTGQESEAEVEELQEETQETENTYFWDGESRNIVKFRKKHRTDVALETITAASKSLRLIDELELDLQGLNVPAKHKRILRLFCKNRNGQSIKVKAISHGLSGASVYRVEVVSSTGVTSATAISKIDTVAEVRKDRRNFQSHVTRLAQGGYPNLIVELIAGGNDIGGVFYSLAGDHEKTFFDYIKDAGVVTEVASQLRVVLTHWNQDRQRVGPVPIRAVRQTLLPDNKIQDIPEPWRNELRKIMDVEDHTVNHFSATQHGDLHGGNILVSRRSLPLLIDFGDVDQKIACLDPVTLELSCFFHPLMKNEWIPDAEAIELYFFSEDYANLTPYPELIRELRAWTESQCSTAREWHVAVYAYCARQLKYKENPELALQLAKQARNLIVDAD